MGLSSGCKKLVSKGSAIQSSQGVELAVLGEACQEYWVPNLCLTDSWVWESVEFFLRVFMGVLGYDSISEYLKTTRYEDVHNHHTFWATEHLPHLS